MRQTAMLLCTAALAALLAGPAAAFFVPGLGAREFSKGDELVVKVNELTSINTQGDELVLLTPLLQAKQSTNSSWKGSQPLRSSPWRSQTEIPLYVRWKEKRRRVDESLPRSRLMEFNSEDEIQQLSLSIDFLVELSDGIFAKREASSSFATFSHQAVDFILASLKSILSSEREKELVEEIIDCLVARLMKRMCTIPVNTGTSDSGSVDFSDAQFSVQHLFRKLGNEEYIGQRIILAVCQKISNVSDRLLLVDPFDDVFPDMHGNMFIMIQLIEFLIADYMKNWLCCDRFDKRLFEEWARSILQARKDLEVLENMNGLYVVYIERVVGRLAREVAPAAHQGKLNLEVFSKLLC